MQNFHFIVLQVANMLAFTESRLSIAWNVFGLTDLNGQVLS